ncbi:MAG: TetR/AcrR family transcriptional regulator C-terminal domain-containing protein [Acidimicrobiales bacterium]|nr:TetR/AcrR family transcriptional regulator C-terminal domain-containing protein [Acidimicrobiales bacterium]
MEEGHEPGSAEWWAAHAERLERRRPRAGGLTVERVVDEALELVDEAGLGALTVRRLAARLETSSATLYRHVASVDELSVLVVDRVLGEVEIPDVGDPARDRVVALAGELRRVLRRHPNVVPALPAAPLLGPNAMAGASAGLEALLDTGLAAVVAVPGYLAMIDFVLGSVFFDTGGSAERHAERVGEDAFQDTPELDRVHRNDVFDLAIDAFLDGLEAQAGAGR